MKKWILIGVVIWASIHYGNQENCPSMCDCDVFNDLNRADCSGHHLISTQIEMPKHVEILDLSQNEITSLDDDSFNDLKLLQTLILANNTIQTIHLDAFEKLRKLEFIDLSYNRLSKFDEKILENNHNLQTIKLRGNKFMNLENEPILKCTSLQNLDLHNSQISHIYTNLFKNIPRLKTLDLSNNLLITLDKDVFKHNRKLKAINLKNNPWICDNNLEETVKWLRKRHVDVEITECVIPKSKPMFERMRLDPSQMKTSPSTAKPIIEIDSVWKIKNELCPLADAEKACDMYESCSTKFSSFYKEMEVKFEQMKKVGRKRLDNFLGAEFYVGLFTGIIFGGTVIYLIILLTKCNGTKSKRNRSLDNENSPEISAISTNQTSILTPPIIISQRRSRRPRDRAINRQLISSVDAQRPSFFASLFQPRARRYYYRSATNMVRRLSQSRLFLNTSRSDSTEQNRTDTPNSMSDITRLIDTNNPELNSDGNLELSEEPQSIYPTAPLADMNNDDLTPPRPETPPPAYKDLVL